MGDTITGTVKFSNDLNLTVLDSGDYENLQLTLWGSFASYSGTSTLTFRNVQGDFIGSTGGPSGGGGLNAYAQGNLTDTSFSFSGFDYSIFISGIYDRNGDDTDFGTDFATYASFSTRRSVLNVASAVPETSTWLMMIAGFGGIGFALRRKKTTTRIRFA